VDIQNKVSIQRYFGYPKYLFLISKISISDIQKKRLFRISQIVAHLKLEVFAQLQRQQQSNIIPTNHVEPQHSSCLYAREAAVSGKSPASKAQL